MMLGYNEFKTMTCTKVAEQFAWLEHQTTVVSCLLGLQVPWSISSSICLHLFLSTTYRPIDNTCFYFVQNNVIFALIGHVKVKPRVPQSDHWQACMTSINVVMLMSCNNSGNTLSLCMMISEYKLSRF